jgi:uncharacterized protein (TIGR02611 family)
VSAEGERHHLIARLAERRERHRDRHLIVRGLTVVAGATILVGGLAMLLLPGPALAVIPLGLALLALEFAWAERALEKAIDQAERAGRAAQETTAAQRVVVALCALLAAGALVAWGILGDIPVLPV